MTFGKIAALILFACALFGAYYFLEVIVFRKKQQKPFAGLALFSAWWSCGFGLMFWQVDIHQAYIWRSVGMVGVFGYIICMTILVATLYDVPKKLKQFGIAISFLGIFICPLTIQKGSATFELMGRGMSYQLSLNFANLAYFIHTTFMMCLFLGCTIYVIVKEKKKGQRMVLVEILVAAVFIEIGTLLDILMPMTGRMAIPGSCICQYVGMAVMHTALKFREKARLTPENMSSYIYYYLSTPVYMFDEELQIKFVNKAGYEFLNVTEEQCLTFNMKDLFSFGVELQGRENFELREAECLKNHIICDVDINAIRDKFGDLLGYIAITDDLSDKLQYMEELKESKLQAEATNLAKSRFLANMSHEIRTPMHAITGFSELILKQEISKEVQENIGYIKDSAQNLLAIINDILDFSKIESGKLEIQEVPYYSSALLRDAIMVISNQAENKGLRFDVDIDVNFPKKLNGDKIRIRSVLINVLNNAIKYTEKGSVSFKAESTYLSEDLAECVFTVRDTGKGMRKEDMEHLFKAFDRLDKKVNYGVEGSGLGLSICNSYVEMMGGRIEVESEYQKGSTFRVILQQQVLEHEPLDMEYVYEEEREEGQLRIRQQEILVVDDNEINLMVAEGLLSAYGGKVDIAAGGQEAIEACQKKNYDMIFMDQMMPEIDGTTAMQEIRKLSSYYEKEAVILVLTVDAIVGMRERFLEEGFDEYLSKPIDISKLEKIFRRFLPEECIYYEVENK